MSPRLALRCLDVEEGEPWLTEDCCWGPANYWPHIIGAARLSGFCIHRPHPLASSPLASTDFRMAAIRHSGGRSRRVQHVGRHVPALEPQLGANLISRLLPRRSALTGVLRRGRSRPASACRMQGSSGHSVSCLLFCERTLLTIYPSFPPPSSPALQER